MDRTLLVFAKLLLPVALIGRVAACTVLAAWVMHLIGMIPLSAVKSFTDQLGPFMPWAFLAWLAAEAVLLGARNADVRIAKKAAQRRTTQRSDAQL